MVIGVCPNCGQRFSYNSYDSDYVHKCNSPSQILNEDDVQRIGTYTDEKTGSSIEVPKLKVVMQGTANKLDKQDVALEGEKSTTLTLNGNNVAIYRQRQHYESIDLKGDK